MCLISPAKVDQGFWWVIEISSGCSDGSSLFGVCLILADVLVINAFSRQFQWGLNQTRLSIIQTTEVRRTLWFMEESTGWIDGRYLFRVRWVSLVIVEERALSRWNRWGDLSCKIRECGKEEANFRSVRIDCWIRVQWRWVSWNGSRRMKLQTIREGSLNCNRWCFQSQNQVKFNLVLRLSLGFKVAMKEVLGVPYWLRYQWRYLEIWKGKCEGKVLKVFAISVRYVVYEDSEGFFMEWNCNFFGLVSMVVFLWCFLMAREAFLRCRSGSGLYQATSNNGQTLANGSDVVSGLILLSPRRRVIGTSKDHLDEGTIRDAGKGLSGGAKPPKPKSYK